MYDRMKTVEIFNGWRGAVKGDKIHKEIVDTYNDIKPLPYGYKLTYKDHYCAGTVSAIFHKAGYDAIFPASVSCTKIIEGAQKMGIWVENDAFVPRVGDCVVYDWEDDKKNYATTDNKNAPNHIGLVIASNGKEFTVGEGNMGTSHVVGVRNMKVNGLYIRGFVCPKFESASAPVAPAPVKKPVTKKPADLTIGSKGEDVIKLHKRLRDFKYGVSATNDTFDMLTRACVVHYQTTHGLEVDGIVGANTRKSLGM